MEYIQFLNPVTPREVIDAKYYKAKEICSEIWSNPDRFWFEDVFHQTMLNCLQKFDGAKWRYDELKGYFFKAFRINMVRHYLYSYNKDKSGLYVQDLIIPVEYNIDDHMDGYSMIDWVRKNKGDEVSMMLWDNLNGMTYKELQNKYGTKSIYYILNNLKEELKRMYLK